jgi:hypothetical protein
VTQGTTLAAHARNAMQDVVSAVGRVTAAVRRQTRPHSSEGDRPHNRAMILAPRYRPPIADPVIALAFPVAGLAGWGESGGWGTFAGIGCAPS